MAGLSKSIFFVEVKETVVRERVLKQVSSILLPSDRSFNYSNITSFIFFTGRMLKIIVCIICLTSSSSIYFSLILNYIIITSIRNLLLVWFFHPKTTETGFLYHHWNWSSNWAPLCQLTVSISNLAGIFYSVLWCWWRLLLQSLLFGVHVAAFSGLAPNSLPAPFHSFS